jgi:hypothetical protein
MPRSRRSVPFTFALALFTLPACESREAGAGCSSDWECASNSCTFGTCDSDLFSLLGLAADIVAASNQRPSETTPYTPPPASWVCSGLSAETCSATPDCQLLEYCLPPSACPWRADAGLGCFECMHTPGCPAPCEVHGYCH